MTVTRVLFILNDPPYGSERSYNGFRLATSLSEREDAQVKVFLLGDAVSCRDSVAATGALRSGRLSATVK